MRKIEFTSRFKRDLKRESRGQHRRLFPEEFDKLVELLCADTPLPVSYCDHALTGEWTDHRDCHVKPDLVLIYRKPNDSVLQLVRLGSHSELQL
jgi:mRNA interferase YafQ